MCPLFYKKKNHPKQTFWPTLHLNQHTGSKVKCQLDLFTNQKFKDGAGLQVKDNNFSDLCVKHVGRTGLFFFPKP